MPPQIESPTLVKSWSLFVRCSRMIAGTSWRRLDPTVSKCWDCRTASFRKIIRILARGVLRGLHFQWEPPMGKLMHVTRGAAFLVAVDVRGGSPTVGQWFGIEASAQNHKFVWAPAHFARGFCALTDDVEVQYLCTGLYNSKGESAVRWDDPDIGIKWPIQPWTISEKDRKAQTLSEWLASNDAQHFAYAISKVGV